jgi:hypothetical protein
MGDRHQFQAGADGLSAPVVGLLTVTKVSWRWTMVVRFHLGGAGRDFLVRGLLAAAEALHLAVQFVAAHDVGAASVMR